MEALTLEEQATNAATSQHIRTVQMVLHLIVKDLLDRADAHDQSKLQRPEVELFTKYTPLLAGCTYGSEEYEGFRKAMGPALAHHYARNDHHPEHFAQPEAYPDLEHDIKALAGVQDLGEALKKRIVDRLRTAAKTEASSLNGMNLLQIVEMFADWKAATLRHNDGNLRKSIEHNAGRFGMSPQLVRIFENTAALVDAVRG